MQLNFKQPQILGAQALFEQTKSLVGKLISQKSHNVCFYDLPEFHPNCLNPDGSLIKRASIQNPDQETITHESTHIEAEYATGCVPSLVNFDGNSAVPNPHVRSSKYTLIDSGESPHQRIALGLNALVSTIAPKVCSDMRGLEDPKISYAYGNDNRVVSLVSGKVAKEILRLRGIDPLENLDEAINLSAQLRDMASITAKRAVGSLDPDSCRSFELEVGQNGEFTRNELINLGNKHGILAKDSPPISKSFTKKVGLHQADIQEINRYCILISFSGN